MMTKNELIRILLSSILIPIGAVVVLVAQPAQGGTSSAVDALFEKFGLALMVAGLIGGLQEGILRRLGRKEGTNRLAKSLIERIRESPPTVVGIRLVSPVRKGYEGYYRWAIHDGIQDMFFAGRAVLQRIEKDFGERILGQTEEVIARRLKEGCQLRILFMDPRSELIPRLAREEDQPPEQFLSDLAISIGTCSRIARELTSISPHPRARLAIHVFDEVPYFAYHRVNEHVIVGFYFTSVVGHQSAAFEVVDSQTEQFFESHFSSILARARESCIVRLDADRRELYYNHELVADLRKPLVDALGEKEADRLLGADVTNPV